MSAPFAPALQLYPYQQRWLDDPAPFKLARFARQTGKTFTTTLEIVLSCLKAELEGRRERWVILSRGERQAREAMEEGIKPHARAIQLILKEMPDYDWRDEAGSYRALEVELPGGSRITALPANPATARGFSANVFLDEFAFHPDGRAIWMALFPVISKPGLRLRVTSTPNGKGNKFYEIDSSKDGTWSRHLVTIVDAVADGLPRNIEQLKAALNDDDAWRQEYMCEYLDEATAWLPYDLIGSCEDGFAGLSDRYEGGPCFIGNDIATRGDLWVAWVLEAIGDVLWTREVVILKRASFATQDATMDELFERYRVTRLAMDQTGMGEKPVEDAKRRYGEARVEGVLFTPAHKLALATAGKQAFEDRTIRIPAGDVAIRADLHKLKKITGPTGIPRFVAESDASGHADRAWACFLACAAADRPMQPAAGISIDPDADYERSEGGLYLPPGFAGRPRARMDLRRPV